jgi:hypothetical protein
MDPTPDELAGVVDLFGALTPPELGEALAEIAFKRGDEYDPDVFEDGIDAALDSYHLVAVDPERADRATEDPLLVAGPVAFPDLPEGGTDLPHILDVPDRELDREAAARAAAERFREDAAGAVAAGDEARIRALVDVSYELEAWGPVELAQARERLDAALA